MDTPILQTKLHVPVLRKDHILRRSLLGRLDAGVANRLSLVCGPAGSGKSTLVSQWMHLRKESDPETGFGWLSLDSGDGDRDRFLTYFIAALRTIDEEGGHVALSLVTAPFPTDAEAVLTVLINEIADGERVLSTECTFCQTCTNVCPEGILDGTMKFDIGGKERLRRRDAS